MDHSAEREQTLVDLPSFLRTLAHGTSVFYRFRSGKVNKVESCNKNRSIRFVSYTRALLALDYQPEIFQNG
jgi:hypothetical protein